MIAVRVLGMNIRLYTIPGSHPGIAVQSMLERKKIEYRRTDLLPVISKVAVRALRFDNNTVPAIKIDGRRVQGSVEIARELDRIQPEPPLFPSDSGARAEAEIAERFGDADLQHPIRQILWWAMHKDGAPLRSFSEGAKLGIPIGLAMRTAAPVVAMAARFNGANDENTRAALAALPGMLRRIDDWIADGVLNAENHGAAEIQIGASLRLAMALDDLRPFIEPRPCGQMALEVVPSYPGKVPPILPEQWLAPLRDAAAN